MRKPVNLCRFNGRSNKTGDGNPDKMKKTIIILSLIAAVILVLFTGFSIYIYSNTKVFPGVKIGSVDAGGYNVDELTQLLNEETERLKTETVLTLQAGTHVLSVLRSDIEFVIDARKTAEAAYSIGHSGSFLQRFGTAFSSLFSGKLVETVSEYNHDKLEKKVNKFYKKTYVKPQNAFYTVNESEKTVTVNSGHTGQRLKKKEVLNVCVEELKTQDESVLNFDYLPVPQKNFDSGKLYEELASSMQNATVRYENNQMTYVPEKYGFKIQKDKLNAAIERISGIDNAEESIPVSLTKPEITLSKLKQNIFKDTLGTRTTNFAGSTSNRITNIKLAASKINGYVMAPGDIFSYNEVVGERTAAGGFKTAGAYAQGKVIQEIGGGICQVSSTVYSAVLYADIEVVYRTNHMFTVSYVMRGEDATVSWGGPDLKFRNNTDYPIKIAATTSGTYLTVRIIGTKKPGENKVVTLKSITKKTTPAPVQEKKDPSLPAGKRVTLENGHTGYTVELHKKVVVNGKTVRSGLLTTSTYRTSPTIIAVGTKKKASKKNRN